MNANEQDDTATPRAGGDVIWKSASQVSPAGSVPENATTPSPDAAKGETRAAGDSILEGANEKQSGESQQLFNNPSDLSPSLCMRDSRRLSRISFSQRHRKKLKSSRIRVR